MTSNYNLSKLLMDDGHYEVDYDFFEQCQSKNTQDFKNTDVIPVSSPSSGECGYTKFVTEVIIETKKNDQKKITSSKPEDFVNEFEIKNSSISSDTSFNVIESSISNLNIANCIAYEKCEDKEFRSNLNFHESSNKISDVFDSMSECSSTSDLSDLTIITPISSSNISLNLNSFKQPIVIDGIEKPKFVYAKGASQLLTIDNNGKEATSIKKPLESTNIISSCVTTSLINNKIKPKVKCMTFTNEQMRKIKRDNDILLKKIMSHNKPQLRQSGIAYCNNFHRKTSAAINRKKQQKQIDHDNLVLSNKIENIKQSKKSIF